MVVTGGMRRSASGRVATTAEGDPDQLPQDILVDLFEPLDVDAAGTLGVPAGPGGIEPVPLLDPAGDWADSRNSSTEASVGCVFAVMAAAASTFIARGIVEGREFRHDGSSLMHAELIAFGTIEVDGRRYENDVVIDRGVVTKRHKKASKRYRDAYGHTPLSVDETIPWGGDRLIVGTGAEGALPIMSHVREEAARRGIELVAVPTAQACRLIESLDSDDVRAILHITC